MHVIAIRGRGEPVKPTVWRRRGAANDDWEYKVELHGFPKSKTKATQTSTPSNPCNPQPRNPDEYDGYIKAIFDNIQETHSSKLLFFIHGGMNDLVGAVKRAAELVDRDNAAWTAGHAKQRGNYQLSTTGYPIFICWESPPTGYFEQLIWVRAGRSERYGQSIAHKFYAYSTIPFHFIADVGRGVTRFPAELSEFVHNDMYSVSPKLFSEFKQSRDETEYINKCPDGNVRATREIDVAQSPARFLEDTQTAVLFPVRTLTLPLIDSIGVGAWENMLRHIDTMFDRTDTSGYKHPTPVEEAVERDQTGALAIFFSHLRDDSVLSKLPITLVGHSMGAIVCNRIVGGYPTLKYPDIVYMGAACSVREFQASVVPYLVNNPDTHFYNLSLHPQCEAGEISLSQPKIKFDVAPRGSLLVWLDNILTRPPAEDERRLGIFQTAVLSSHNFPKTIRPKITLKCFGFDVREPCPPLIWYPQHHADFSNSPFWNPNFWDLNGRPPSPKNVASR